MPARVAWAGIAALRGLARCDCGERPELGGGSGSVRRGPGWPEAVGIRHGRPTRRPGVRRGPVRPIRAVSRTEGGGRSRPVRPPAWRHGRGATGSARDGANGRPVGPGPPVAPGTTAGRDGPPPVPPGSMAVPGVASTAAARSSSCTANWWECWAITGVTGSDSSLVRAPAMPRLSGAVDDPGAQGHGPHLQARPLAGQLGPPVDLAGAVVGRHRRQQDQT